MKFILGTKQHMTELFDADGRVWPATIVSAGPVTVTDIRTSERDGYSAVQVGYGTQKESRISKPQLGHLKGAGPFRVLREFAGDKTIVIEDVKVGDVSPQIRLKKATVWLYRLRPKARAFRAWSSVTVFMVARALTARSIPSVNRVRLVAEDDQAGAWSKVCAWPGAWVATVSPLRI